MLSLPLCAAMHHNSVAPTFSFVTSASSLTGHLQMARGWESKSVEEQQSQAASMPSDRNNGKSQGEQASARNREALQLARARIQQQLEAATNERYAEQLRQAMAAIDKQLAQG